MISFIFLDFPVYKDDLKAKRAILETHKRVQRLNDADSPPMILQL